MSTRERAEAFVKYVGLELKGRIISQGFTAQEVAQGTGRSISAFNRWLNGKVDIPLAVVCESCEYIGFDIKTLVEDAYSRMAIIYGEVDGTVYDDDTVRIALAETERLRDGDNVVRFPGEAPMSDLDDTLKAAREANDDLEAEAQQDEP